MAKQTSRRSFLRTAAATGLAAMAGCASTYQNKSSVSRHNPIHPTPIASPSQQMSYENTKGVVDQYDAGIPKVSGTIYFPGAHGEVVALPINTTGPSNNQGTALAIIQNSFAQVVGGACDCDVTKTFYELGPADTCTDTSRSYQLGSNNTGLLGVASLSSGRASYTFTRIQQEIGLDRRSMKKSKIQGQITFGEPAFRACMNTRDPVSWIMEPMEAGAIGYLATGGNPLGFGIGAGGQLLNNTLDAIRGRRTPARAYHTDAERIITGKPFDFSQTKASLERLNQLHGNTLALVPWTRQVGIDECNQPGLESGLGVVYGRDNLTITGFGDVDNDGCVDTVCFETEKILGDHLCDLFGMAVWAALGVVVNEKIVKEYEDYGGGRAGRSGGDSPGYPTSGGERGGGVSGGNRHGLPIGGGGSGGEIGGDGTGLPSGSGRSQGGIGGGFGL